MDIKLLDLPQELHTCAAKDVWRFCPPLSLYKIPGLKKPELVISILLHGNEDAGLLTLQKLFAKYEALFPRECILLVGNTLAAKQEVRHLDDQPDFNRIWLETGTYSEQQQAQDLLSFFEKTKPFAFIDLHNNTGTNPHYICINKKEQKFLQLADLFDGPTVFFDDPKDVLTIATSKFSPSAILECGLPGDVKGAERACSFLEKLLECDDWPQLFKKKHPILEVVAKLSIPNHVSFNVGQGSEKVILNENLEKLNFKEILNNEPIAKIKEGPLHHMLRVTNRDGQDLTDHFLELIGEEVFIKPGVTPSMLTLNHKVTEQDVLGYLMKRNYY